MLFLLPGFKEKQQPLTTNVIIKINLFLAYLFTFQRVSRPLRLAQDEIGLASFFVV